jgi:hypothetical protein
MTLHGRGLLFGWLLGATLGCGGAPHGAGDVSLGASRGYVLFSPILSYTTYLIDGAGRVVHTWESRRSPGVSPYLLDDGHLLLCVQRPGAGFRHGGHGGRIQEFSWDGEILWDWVAASDAMLQHHDIEPLPNGNVLLVAWELKTREQAIRAGRDPRLVDSLGLWPDFILEVRPERPTAAAIVWEWHVWDHLIQDHDPAGENYGEVSEHPELVDLNAAPSPGGVTGEAIERLKAVGYLGGETSANENLADFMHTNSVAYHPRLDHLALSVPTFNEIWILDHGTTTKEAAGHTGGRAGRGGDLLYRWGNPRVYRHGAAEDQRLFAQHDARWIPAGYPGAGNLTVFNNGTERPGPDYSSVMEITPPLGARGRYVIGTRGRFGPDAPVWEYPRTADRSFLAEFISGAQRLPDGGTLICDGPRGRLFVVTPAGKIVWEYQNPYSGDAPNPNGDPPYAIFRATFIPADHPAVAGKELEPLAPQPPVPGTSGHR